MAEGNISTSIHITPRTRRKMVAQKDETDQKTFLKKQEYISDELDGLITTTHFTDQGSSTARKVNTIDYAKNRDSNNTHNNKMLDNEKVETTFFVMTDSVKSVTSLRPSQFPETCNNKFMYDENRNIVSNANIDNSISNKQTSSQYDNSTTVKTIYHLNESNSDQIKRSIDVNSTSTSLNETMGNPRSHTSSPQYFKNTNKQDVLPDMEKPPHGYTALTYPLRSRNKSDSDTVEFANVDTLYENGMFTKLVVTSDESINSRPESPAKKRSNTYTPEKPKRSFDRNHPHGGRIPVNATTSLDDLKELASDCVMTSMKLNKGSHVFSTKEAFDNFIATEKANYSPVVTDESAFLSGLDQSLNDLSSPAVSRDKSSFSGSSRYLSEKSKLLAKTGRDRNNRRSGSDPYQRMESPLTSSCETMNSRSGCSPTLDTVSIGTTVSYSSNRHTLTEDCQKIEELENVLDSQIEQLENLLTTTLPNKNSTLNNTAHDATVLNTQNPIDNISLTQKHNIETKESNSILENRLENLFQVAENQIKNNELPYLISPDQDTERVEMYVPNKVSDAELISKASTVPRTSHWGRRGNKNYVDPSKRTILPDIPENDHAAGHNSFGMKSIRKSLRSAKNKLSKLPNRSSNQNNRYAVSQNTENKRDKKASQQIIVSFLSKSFRLPKSKNSKRQVHHRHRNNSESSTLVSMRYNTKDSRTPDKFLNDRRTSKMMAIDYENIKLQLDREKQEIEEERNRLIELKRQAEEKADLQWKGRNIETERREIEELESQKEKLEQLKREQELKAEAELKLIQEETEKMKKHEVVLKQREQELAELHKERERREELEKLLKSGKENETILVKTLDEEKRKLNTLEKSLSEEKTRRLEIEKRLQDEEMRNKLNDEKKKAPDTRSNGAPSMNGTLKRRIPSYTFSLRSGQSSGNSDDINLLHHIAAAGHVIENCPVVKINRYSCRGFLLKMGKSRLSVSPWKRRWFVFDRKLRALCYYQDDRKTKSKGILYFQSIQDVFVDASIKRSPNPKTTFCVRTPQRTYVLNAPSPTAMSIWIDVIFTGMEGNFMSMTL